jgi:hypothetical protein
MSARATAVLVAIAVVGGITVAAVGLATRGSSKRTRVLQIDEVNGRVGKVVLGETRANVIGTLGKPPGRDIGFGGPFLRYDTLVIEFRRGKVFAITTTDPAAQTEKVVKIGEPLSAVRASYREAAKCVPNSPDKTDPHPRCTVKVPAGRLFVRGDPIKTLTLTRTR